MQEIFIPLGGKDAWQDNELRYCLRSLETNMLHPFKVTVYSDHEVPWLKNVDFKIVERFRSGHPFENFWDTINKIHLFARNANCKEFLYLYDDCCLLRKVMDFNSLENIALQRELPEYRNMRTDKHGITLLSSIDAINEPVCWNYETHIPRLYNRKKLIELYKVFGIFDFKYPPALATLYFNHFYAFPYSMMSEKGQSFRASFCFEDNDISGSYLVSSIGEIEMACLDKLFLHYNDKGLNFAPNGKQILKEYIMSLFPNKSRFEI